MSDVSSCVDCAHLQGTSTCGRPVPSYWNPATNQRRSRLTVAATFERSDRKFFGRTREKCGPDALFFEPKCPPIGSPLHDILGDSDRDDGA